MLNSNHNYSIDITQNFIRKIEFLDSETRNKGLSPEEILHMVPIKKTDCILDLGAGSGFLTIPVAKMVVNTVFALDLDVQMLSLIDTKAKNESISNIKTLQSNVNMIPLSEKTINLAIASLILHEVIFLSDVLQEINRVLKDDGYILILEYEKDEAFKEGPPMHIRIKSSELEQELTKTGFRVVEKVPFGGSQYIIIAQKFVDK